MWRPEARSERLSDEQERELAALDRLLGGPVGPGEDEAGLGGLGALVVAVRDDRPPLRPAFAVELDARVAAGFSRQGAGPAPGRAGRAAGAAGRVAGAAGRVAGAAGRVAGAAGRVAGAAGRVGTGRWLTGLGAAAALAVAVAVVAGSPGRPQSGGNIVQSAEPPAAATGSPAMRAPAPATGSSAGQGAEASPAVRAPAPVTGSAAGQSAAASPPAAAPFAAVPAPIPAPAVGAGGGARAVQRDATLGLLAARGQVQRVADRAIAAIDRLGGIVLSSQVALDDQGSSQATLELQVPGVALDRTLAALSALAHVSTRTQDALDITDATGAARDRLAESRAQRHALLRQLGRATTPNQVASIRAQLGLVAGRIATDQAQLSSLLTRGQFAHLSVTITEGQQAAGGGGSGSGWGPGAALDDALSVLEAAFAVLVIALAGFVPVAVLGGLACWGLRPVRRRRREGALLGGSPATGG